MLLTIFQTNPFLEWLSYPPGSMFLILLIAAGTALLSAGLTKWLVDTDELNRKQVAIKAHEEEKEKIIALAEKDVERYKKARKQWERKSEMFKQTQQRMSFQRIKPSCISWLPMIIIFGIIRVVFGNNPIALSPMNANDVPLIGGMLAATSGGKIYLWTRLVYEHARVIPIAAGWINFTSWYFLCNFGIGTLVQRIFGMQTQAYGGMNQLMGGGRAKALDFPEV
jgi:uncharacterized membrane protein (DUF106 family)